jgi:signal transduction histidine kinase
VTLITPALSAQPDAVEADTLETGYDSPFIDRVVRVIDWFIPEWVHGERNELAVWRNYVFTHLAGPLMAQSISFFLYYTDQSHGLACWTMIVGISAFWSLSFVLKYTQSLSIAAIGSVQMLCMASLGGAFFYGGVASPFLPWILVAVLLGFFYLSDRPKFVALLLISNISAFALVALCFGFPEIVPLHKLTQVGWISVISGCIYMAWMAIFYSKIMSIRSSLQRETDNHRDTADRLQKAKETAERVSRAKSIFLARMSHELRTPLNAVIGYSEILLEDVPDKGDPQRRSDLQRINDAGKHLLSLVTEVLDISKIERNDSDVKAETFDVAIIVEQIKATCDSLAKVKKNELVLDLEPDLGTMHNDVVKFRQILLNLLSNAAKFTTNGRIVISASRRPGPAGEEIEVSVSDSGIGMTEEEISRLFKRFSQASADTEKRFGGSGLGLSICASFCTLMGGSIGVESAIGKGARFTVVIPVELPISPHAVAPVGGNLALAS